MFTSNWRETLHHVTWQLGVSLHSSTYTLCTILYSWCLRKEQTRPRQALAALATEFVRYAVYYAIEPSPRSQAKLNVKEELNPLLRWLCCCWSQKLVEMCKMSLPAQASQASARLVLVRWQNLARPYNTCPAARSGPARGGHAGCSWLSHFLIGKKKNM